MKKEKRSPKNTFYISRNFLKAALRIAAKNDIRYYLNSVYIEVDKNSTTIVSTDGRSLLIIRDDVENTWQGKLLISPEIARRLTTGKPHKPSIGKISVGASRGELFFADDLSLRDVKISFKSADGVDKYPDYKKVVPKEISGEPGSINPSFLYQMNMAAKDAGASGPQGNHIRLHQNGESGCAICTANNVDGFIGLIMPYKSASSVFVTPKWLKDTREK